MMNRNMGTGFCSLAMGDTFSQALGAAAEDMADRTIDFAGNMDGMSFRECASGMHGRVKHYAYPNPDEIDISDEDSENT